MIYFTRREGVSLAILPGVAMFFCIVGGLNGERYAAVVACLAGAWFGFILARTDFRS